MKSIANQYRDLKEGKMSQANFMRNLRMNMPQYITNVTSFNDAVKILKNKSILTESHENIDEASNDAPSYNYNGKKLYVDNQSGEPDAPGGTASLYDEDKNEYTGIISSIDKDGFLYIDEETIKPVGGNDDDEIEAMIKKMEQEKAGEEAAMSQFDPMEEELTEGRKKKDQKEFHPNQIHPQELRMGIRVELEHTDDLDKAKKIALDHLAENPFYYTALKLSGIESPSAPKAKTPKEAPKKVKKKDATELVDKANQMQKVKMPKIVKEVKTQIFPGEEANETLTNAQNFIDSNLTLKKYSDQIELQQQPGQKTATLIYNGGYELPLDVLEKLKIQFDVKGPEVTDQDDRKDIISYTISLKKEGPEKFRAFQSKLEEIVREVMTEYYDGRDNLDENSGFEWTGDYIQMNDDIKDKLMNNIDWLSDGKKFVRPKQMNGKYNWILWIDPLEPEQFDEIANLLGIKY